MKSRFLDQRNFGEKRSTYVSKINRSYFSYCFYFYFYFLIFLELKKIYLTNPLTYFSREINQLYHWAPGTSHNLVLVQYQVVFLFFFFLFFFFPFLLLFLEGHPTVKIGHGRWEGRGVSGKQRDRFYLTFSYNVTMCLVSPKTPFYSPPPPLFILIFLFPDGKVILYFFPFPYIS